MSYPHAEIPSTLIAHWTFDTPSASKVTDSSGNFNNAEIIGSGTTWTTSACNFGNYVTTPEDQDIIIPLNGTSSTNAELIAYIISLPTVGTLYHADTAWGRGARITVAGTRVNGPFRRVIYAPPSDSYGYPLTSFTYNISDGTTMSQTATLSIHVSPMFDSPLVQIPLPHNTSFWNYQ